MAHTSRFPRLPLGEAKRLRDMALRGLRDTERKDKRAKRVTQRLDVAVQDNVREAMEQQLRGGHHG